MIAEEGRSDDGSAIVVSSNQQGVTTGTNHTQYFRNSNATSVTTTSMTNTTNSSSNSNANTSVSVANSGTMIRNRPSTTASVLRTDDVNINNSNVEMPLWTTTTGEDNVSYSKKSAVNFNDQQIYHPTYSNRNISPNNTTKNKKSDDDDDDDNIRRYPVREMQFYIRGLQDPIVINPMVSFYAILILWSVVIWTIVNPENSLQALLHLRSNISLHFTWLFISSKAFFFFFMLYICYRYGHIKLGNKDDVPEFTLLTYSCMIFATGVASGFFVYAVAEPLFHQHSHFFANPQYRSQDEVDMFAINLTVNNWAITGWTGYTVVAVCMSLATHRFHLPFTARSCFYPILHHYTWGWIGDVIDGMTIVISIGGISTSLGLGAAEIVTGLVHLGFVDKYSRLDHMTSIQITTTWVITIICTASVISGVHGGIKLLSLIACAVGLMLLCTILLLDDTKFLLNLVVQEFGYFLQTSLFQLNFWTDAFGQLREGSGRAIDGKASADWWMDAWTVFYVGWWVSWAGFVGLMVARISRGRTLRELILHTLILPIITCLVWFSIWGGIGLRQSRQGLELETLGGTHFNDTSYFSVPDSEFCYNVPQEDVEVNGEVIFTNYLPGITPVCQFDSSKSSTASFNVLYSFSFPESFQNGGFGPTLAVVYILALTLFFVTSSDSGSLIVDHIASNGSNSHHWVRRMFWSITQGALSTALLSSGGATALKAVQAMAILCGLPYIILMIFMVQSTILLCRAADTIPENEDYDFPDQPEFVVPVYGGMLNIVEYVSSFGYVKKERIELGIDRPTKKHMIEFIKGVFVPSISLFEVLAIMYPRNRNLNFGIASLYTLPYYGWIVLFSIPGSYYGFRVLSSVLFVSCGAMLGALRNIFRSHYNDIRSNCAADFCASLLLWPQVLSQMRLHAVMVQQQTKIKVDDNEIPPPWMDEEMSDSISSAPNEIQK